MATSPRFEQLAQVTTTNAQRICRNKTLNKYGFGGTLVFQSKRLGTESKIKL